MTTIATSSIERGPYYSRSPVPCLTTLSKRWIPGQATVSPGKLSVPISRALSEARRFHSYPVLIIPSEIWKRKQLWSIFTSLSALSSIMAEGPASFDPSSHPGPTASDSITSFLGYMQRRLSGFASDAVSFRRIVEEDEENSNDTADTEGQADGSSSRQPKESPSLHRAGLLQPKSYNTSNTMPASYNPDLLHPHTPDSIRAATVELSAMDFPSASLPSGSYRSSHIPVIREATPTGQSTSAFIFPATLQNENNSTSSLGLDREHDQASPVSRSLTSSFLRDVTSSESALDSSLVTLATTSETPAERPKMSGLSLARPPSSGNSSSRSSSTSSARSEGQEASSSERPVVTVSGADYTPTATPISTPRPFGQPLPLSDQARVHWQSPTVLSSPLVASTPLSSSTTRPLSGSSADERTPLLMSRSPLRADDATPTAEMPHSSLSFARQKGVSGSNGGGNGRIELPGDEEEAWNAQSFLHGSSTKPRSRLHFKVLEDKLRTELRRTPEHAATAVKAIPAVLLGSLLNILDGVSYGMILFPATGVFAGLGAMGVSMFFVTAVISQLVYTLGGSGFAGANGSMMIEVVPFFHILATDIAAEIGDDQPLAIIATTLVAYALSSILTGLSFLLLGALKLGVVVGFFPRHILVGCIGGVGVFLIQTGLTVSMRISEENFTMTWKTFEFMFFNVHNLILWTLPLGLAILLRVVTHKYHHQLIFPLYFIIIPVIFYIVVLAAGLDLNSLRHSGWVFDMGSSSNEPWYQFYSYLDFGLVKFGPLWSTMPTQFALLFFNILHPPLNVPALAVSLNNDVDTNKELVAHGYSNLLAGLFGTVPNYLVYVNTLLFYRVGGDNRISGFLLAVFTAALLFAGSGPIAFIPIMVVGALIFVLGIDLVKEALWDTRHRVTWSEYITIVSIMVCMTVWDFVIGVLFGIIVCCFFFVVQNSQLRSIRAMYTGDVAMSAVRRPNLQRAYIREVSKQTTILRLQGFLFFGTITSVEETIRSLLEGPYWQEHPIQFLVLDFSLVAGVDMSAAEAFVRIQRLLSGKRVTLVLCGFTVDSLVGKALGSVDVLGSKGVELFETFSDAMEWTENAYLRAWFASQKAESHVTSLAVPGRLEPGLEYSQLVGSFVRSPRRSQIRDAGDRTIAADLYPESPPDVNSEPFNTILKAFSSTENVDPVVFQPMVKYLERLSIPAGHVLWRSGDPSDGLYFVEAGMLRATYQFSGAAQKFEESMVGGTIAGEVTALSDSTRNATVVAEHPSVVWKLRNENIRRLQVEEPELGRAFVQAVLKNAKADYDVLLSAIAARH
ncbi:hypothetical protein D9619_008654 [Psilocybe cf. subviscida]|uniref:STAS domain-containing protein n=1 Tax=Psilocybe cf. subviscida TaxID=2480587 RepID=A0A8H5BA39_9AGAR|nr:hypothetical protein D9619_008654 [Psilocybe cf. subviscida]